MSCKENIMITIPAAILNEFEYSKNKFPINEAVAPKEIKTSENPSENKIVLSMIFFFFSTISPRLSPDIQEMYPGIKGKTQGDKKLISPAPKAIVKFKIIILNLWFKD